jgi:hypothetical protein
VYFRDHASSGLVICCLLKHVIKGKIKVKMEVTKGEEKDVSSYCLTLGKREDTVN